MVDMRDETLFKQALQPNTRLVLMETPSNPLMRLVDIGRIVQLVREYNKNILVAVDNTFMTPYFQEKDIEKIDIHLHDTRKLYPGKSNFGVQ
ncbi:putative cystathionine gamma-lyase 2 [Fasciola gigantica]|uniref:Putative cystathionine gamma-lyase 2 n=1 Tax=Fasciola gigantica TaxID=46835 RepID=A0A504Z2E3_FASGI|nr:putative cystathionine gamma-lyase 2 [Fasciola gigantica]